MSAFSMHQQVARPAATAQTKDMPQAGQVLASGFSGTFDMIFLALQFHSHGRRGKATRRTVPKRQYAGQPQFILALCSRPAAGMASGASFLPILRPPRRRCARRPGPAPEPTRPIRRSDRVRKATTAYARQSPLCRRGRSWRANGAASTAIAAAASRTVKPSMLRGSAAHHPDELSLLLALSSREC